jgi:hypothetical protein
VGIAEWMGVVESFKHLAQLSGQFRRPQPRPNEAADRASGGAGQAGQLETRLASVLVAALREAFDRDRARIDLERDHLEAERKRAEDALRSELRRQDLDRAQGRVRLLAIAAIGVWMLSAALAVWLPGMHAGPPKWLLGGGWLLVLAALASSLSSWRALSLTSSSADGRPGATLAESVGMWCLLGAIALTGAALLSAL